MRANKRKPVGAADLTSAWEAVFTGMEVVDFETCRAQGWLRTEDIINQSTASIASVRCQLQRMVHAGELERKKIRVNVDGVARMINIYRPRK
jgi:hypothetical protein